MHLPHPRLHLRQAVFCHRKDYGRGLHLGNHDQHRTSGRLHHVSGIDQAKTHPAGNRGRNVAVTKLNLVVIHRALIVLDRALILQDNLFLVIQQLLGNSVLSPRRSIAVEIHLGLRQNIGIAL